VSAVEKEHEKYRRLIALIRQLVAIARAAA
jgi:hypothetical protein